MRYYTREDLIEIFVKFRAENLFCTFVSCTKHPVEVCKIINVHEDNFLAKILWKGTNWRFILPWRVINWHVLQIIQGSYQVRNLFGSWLVIFRKKVSQGVSFLMVHMWHVKLQQGTQKRDSLEFLNLSALKLPSCELVFFINMNTY